MKKIFIGRAFAFTFALAALATTVAWGAPQTHTATLTGAKWIWHPQGHRDHCKVFLKASFEAPAALARAQLIFACDNGAIVKVNGQEVARQGSGHDDWRQPTVAWDIRSAVKAGRNTVEVEGENVDSNWAGFIAAFEFTDAQGRVTTVRTDDLAWQASLDGKTFVQPDVSGEYGCSPWGACAEGVRLAAPRMREIAGVPAYTSTWIAAADAPATRRETTQRQISEEGTSWFVSRFTNKQAITRAEWVVSGLGVFEVYVNGQNVGAEQALKPGFTHAVKTKYYYTYDVTKNLNCARGATNTLSAEVSAGWWRDKIVNYLGKKSAFRAELLIEYADGRKEVLTTNTTDWKAGIGGPVKRAAVFDGEIYDARIAAPWEGLSSFKPAEAFKGYNGDVLPNVGAEVVRRFDLVLKPVEAYCWRGTKGSAPKVFGTVVKTRVFKPNEPFTVMPGETLVVDFGQNAAAVPHFKMKAAAGTTLTCLPGEMLNDGNGERSRGNDGPAGSLYRENLRIANDGMRCVYTFADNEADYFPRFTFFGYRYLSITATDVVTLTVESLPVTSITKEMELGQITTGNKDVNRLIANVYWGQLSNYLSVPTDCPQRNERLGWTADTQVFAEAGTFNADTSRFFHKWMRDMRDTQHPKGGFPGVAPAAQYGGSAMRLGWADAGVIVPYQVWKQFADTKIVEENWDAMARYVARCAETKYEHKATAEENGRYQWADWLSYEGVPGHERFAYWDYLGACYWLWDARMMQEMGAAIGKDASGYVKMAAEAKAYIQTNLMNPDGTFKLATLNRLQTPTLFALKLGLVEGEAKAKMIANLRQNFKDHGDCLQTGFLGTSILMDTLTENGMSDIAYTLLLQHKNPSWLYSVDQGATTIWERWNSYRKDTGFGPVGMNSFNHYAYGAVLAWIYKTGAGIAADPKAPGFRNIVMAPKPDRRLGSLKAQYKTRFGLVKSAWRYEGETWVWDVTVPTGATASITLPGEKQTRTYPAGTYRFTRKGL